MMPSAMIKPDNRLHPLGDTDNQHNQQHGDTGNNTAGSNRQIASILFQRMVHDHHNHTARQLHGKWRHADRKYIPNNGTFQPEIFRMETYDTILADKMTHHESGTGSHGDHRSDSGTLYPHIQPEDKDRV